MKADLTGKERGCILAVELAAQFGAEAAAARKKERTGAEDTVAIQMVTLAPAGTSPHLALQRMGEDWTRISAGRVKLKIFPGYNQGGEKAIVDKMGIGGYQGAVMTVVGLSRIDPAVTALANLPMMFRSLDEVDHVRDKLSAQLDARLLEKGYVALFWSDVGWVRFFSKAPLTRPNELKRMKLFVWGTDAGYDVPQQLFVHGYLNLEGRKISKTLGNVVDRAPFRAKALVDAIRPLGMPAAACVHDSKRSGFTPYTPPIDYPINDKNEKGSFKYHLYSQDDARRNQYNAPTVQFLGCGVGGVDGENGSRIRISGPGMAFNDANGSNVIGTRWREGKTPEDYSIELGFEVPVRGVTVKGSIQQHPRNSLKGSVLPPHKQKEMEQLHRNAVNAWWEDGCRPYCTRWGGSNNYQGSVGEGLWEFPQWYKHDALTRGWKMIPYVEHHCSNPFGC